MHHAVATQLVTHSWSFASEAGTSLIGSGPEQARGAKDGRPSKSLTLEQASRLLDVATATRMHAYIVVSLLTGARTEEMRALTWDHVDLKGAQYAEPPRPPSIEVWRIGARARRHEDAQVSPDPPASGTMR
ncbi:hypothetical protein [Kribbella soli]|uniref:hypothetical protein n=1 Tax=Kribbella soli TaxID=1124743 RepID=UPI00192D7032|nr:hypothetical protein [Kribbella soli]